MFLAHVLMLLLEASLPPLADLEHFPPLHECFDQVGPLERHRAWLLERRRLLGPGDGRLDAWISEVDFRLRYWELLELARREEFGHGEHWNRRWLARLRDLVGPADYAARWSPDRLPLDLHLPRPAAVPLAANNR